MPEDERVHKNDYSKSARDSVAPDSLCVAWLNDGLAWCECWSGVKLQLWLNWYAAAAAAVCVWSHCPLRTLPRLHDGLVAY